MAAPERSALKCPLTRTLVSSRSCGRLRWDTAFFRSSKGTVLRAPADANAFLRRVKLTRAADVSTRRRTFVRGQTRSGESSQALHELLKASSKILFVCFRNRRDSEGSSILQQESQQCQMNPDTFKAYSDSSVARRKRPALCR